MSSIRQLHQHTPLLAVSDARGVLLRSVAYYRADAQTPAKSRITRHDSVSYTHLTLPTILLV